MNLKCFLFDHDWRLRFLDVSTGRAVTVTEPEVKWVYLTSRSFYCKNFVCGRCGVERPRDRNFAFEEYKQAVAATERAEAQHMRSP